MRLRRKDSLGNLRALSPGQDSPFSGFPLLICGGLASHSIGKLLLSRIHGLVVWLTGSVGRIHELTLSLLSLVFPVSAGTLLGVFQRPLELSG